MKLQVLSLPFILLTLFACVPKEKYHYDFFDFKPELQKHLKNIVAEKEIGYNPDTLAVNFLNENCTKEELRNLLIFENPLVRVRAYRAIVNRNEPDYFTLLLDHLDDTAKVLWWYYEDAADSVMVSDLMVMKAENKLSESEKLILTDKILFNHSYLGFSNRVIQELEPNEKYYSMIKEKTKIKTDRCGMQLGACYALSKFKKKEDLLYLKNIFMDLESPCEDWIFESIEENPDTIYFPVLLKYFNENIKIKEQFVFFGLEKYCRAVAKYKTQESLDILLALTQRETYPNDHYFEYNLESVFKAIYKNRAPIYDSLFNSLESKMDD